MSSKLHQPSKDLEDHIMMLCTDGKHEIVREIFTLVKPTPRTLFASAYCDNEEARNILIKYHDKVGINVHNIVSCIQNDNFRPLINIGNEKLWENGFSIIEYLVSNNMYNLLEKVLRMNIYKHDHIHEYIYFLRKYDLSHSIKECCIPYIAYGGSNGLMDYCRKEHCINSTIEFIRQLANIFDNSLKYIPPSPLFVIKYANISPIIEKLCLIYDIQLKQVQLLVDLLDKHISGPFYKIISHFITIPNIRIHLLNINYVKSSDTTDLLAIDKISLLCINKNLKLDETLYDILRIDLDTNIIAFLSQAFGKNTLLDYVIEKDISLIISEIIKDDNIDNLLVYFKVAYKFKARKCKKIILGILEKS